MGNGLVEGGDVDESGLEKKTLVRTRNESDERQRERANGRNSLRGIVDALMVGSMDEINIHPWVESLGRWWSVWSVFSIHCRRLGGSLGEGGELGFGD